LGHTVDSGHINLHKVLLVLQDIGETVHILYQLMHQCRNMMSL